MRIYYCFELEDNKFITEIVEAWLYTLDNDFKETKFCFKDTKGNTYKSETVPYGYALMWLNTLVNRGFVNLENHVFEMEEYD